MTATVAAGNMSTLNCPEEVWLAERLVAMHPWSEMARFARSGGEAIPLRYASLVLPQGEILWPFVVITVGILVSSYEPSE